MARNVIEDSDDDELSSLSPVKPRLPPHDTEPGDPPIPFNASFQQDARTSSLDPPPALLPDAHRAESLAEAEDEADVIPLPVGVKRKPTTVEELASRKRAKISVGDAGVENRSTNGGAPVQAAADDLQETVDAQTADELVSHPTEHEEELRTGSTEFQTVRSCSSTTGIAGHDDETGLEDVPAARSQPAARNNSPEPPQLEEEPALPNGKPADLNTSRPKHKPVILSSDGDADLPPAENYKPRPSRSRAAGTADDAATSVEWGKRPERAAKAGKKERKEKDSKRKKQRDSPPAGDEGESQQTNDAASVGTAAQSLEEVAGEETAPPEPSAKARSEEQASNVESRPEATTTQKRSRGRPRKKDSAPVDAPTEPKKRGRKRRAEAVRTEAAATEAEDGTRASVGSKTQRRRGAVADSDESNDEASEAGDAAGASTESPSAEAPLSPSKRTNGQRPKARTSAVDSAGVENNDPQSATLEGDPPAKDTAPPATPQKAKSTLAVTPEDKGRATDGKGPDKHSPIDGKIKYRVGLSKRARIAPLLQSVKK